MKELRTLKWLATGCVLTVAPLQAADVWVFDPSISLDQRFDDNYFLEPTDDGDLNATRLVGEVGLSRQSETVLIKGLVRVDGLLTTESDAGDEGLESNQLISFDAKNSSERSAYGINVSFKQDTPSRDIAADLSDPGSTATDTGLNPTQFSNEVRQEVTITPSFKYNVTRRLEFNSEAKFSNVEHELPEVQDAIYRQYLSSLPRDETGAIIGDLLSFSEVTLADVGNVFSPAGELDDYQESKIDFGLRYKYDPISTVSLTAAFSRFTADVEIDPFAIVPFENLTADSREPGIRRRPRRESISTTSTLTLGYQRAVTRTLLLGVSAGIFSNSSDTTDTLRAEDRPGEIIPAERLEALQTDTDGWLASLSLNYDAGLTRYAAQFRVDVQPSSSGSNVETQELIGDVYRELSSDLRVSLRARAYEPDRLGANEADRFARRFLSIQPKVEWQYSRNWTFSAAYRYRRQKARVDPISAESNAILFALTYRPPSAIRDAARANGL